MSWSAVLGALDGLISSRMTQAGPKSVHKFKNMWNYIEQLGLGKALTRLRVLHVAGTKGKGSTCVFTEAILRRSGYTTGLLTSPHLCDVRERIRINGQKLPEQEFADAFWRCHECFSRHATDEVPMPAYARFLTLMALQVFVDRDVDAAILEVGLGGRLDDTNVVPRPIATAVTMLDFDHTAILGDTLKEIAFQKAGIFRRGVPAFTCPQEVEGLAELRRCAEEAGCSLSVVGGMRQWQVNGTGNSLPLGINGAHQAVNASIAVELCRAFDTAVATGDIELSGRSAADTPVLRGAGAARVALLDGGVLPDTYCAGLQGCSFPGRGQVLEMWRGGAAAGREEGASLATATLGGRDQEAGSNSTGHGRVLLHLDGAHTPASMNACVRWFCRSSEEAAVRGGAQAVLRLLVFHCQPDKQPDKLLAEIFTGACAVQAPFAHAAFTASGPTQLATGSLQSGGQVSAAQKHSGIWKSMQLSGVGGKGSAVNLEDAQALATALGDVGQNNGTSATVHRDVAAILERLQAGQGLPAGSEVHVLVTGSFYLVGDVLRACSAEPP